MNEKNTKTAISNFIMKICLKERFIEIGRQMLCDSNDFEPYVAYTRLVRDSKDGVTASSIHKFIKENGMEIDLQKCRTMVEHYDSDQDGVLSYKEFLEIVLPKEHPDLRAFVTQRECFAISDDEYLSYDTEVAMAVVLDLEIGFFEELYEQKKRLDELGLDATSIVKLVEGVDFDGGSTARDSQRRQSRGGVLLEKTLSGDGADLDLDINFDNLRLYLNDCGLLPYDSEIISFLRRVDRDDDGVITIQELQGFLGRFRSYTEASRLSYYRGNNRYTKSRDNLRDISPCRKIVKNGKVSLISSGLKSSRQMKQKGAPDIRGSQLSMKNSYAGANENKENTNTSQRGVYHYQKGNAGKMAEDGSSATGKGEMRYSYARKEISQYSHEGIVRGENASGQEAPEEAGNQNQTERGDESARRFSRDSGIDRRGSNGRRLSSPSKKEANVPETAESRRAARFFVDSIRIQGQEENQTSERGRDYMKGDIVYQHSKGGNSNARARLGDSPSNNVKNRREPGSSPKYLHNRRGNDSLEGSETGAGSQDYVAERSKYPGVNHVKIDYRSKDSQSRINNFRSPNSPKAPMRKGRTSLLSGKHGPAGRVGGRNSKVYSGAPKDLNVTEEDLSLDQKNSNHGKEYQHLNHHHKKHRRSPLGELKAPNPHEDAPSTSLRGGRYQALQRDQYIYQPKHGNPIPSSHLQEQDSNRSNAAAGHYLPTKPSPSRFAAVPDSTRDYKLKDSRYQHSKQSSLISKRSDMIESQYEKHLRSGSSPTPSENHNNMNRLGRSGADHLETMNNLEDSTVNISGMKRSRASRPDLYLNDSEIPNFEQTGQNRSEYSQEDEEDDDEDRSQTMRGGDQEDIDEEDEEDVDDNETRYEDFNSSKHSRTGDGHLFSFNNFASKASSGLNRIASKHGKALLAEADLENTRKQRGGIGVEESFSKPDDRFQKRMAGRERFYGSRGGLQGPTGREELARSDYFEESETKGSNMMRGSNLGEFSDLKVSNVIDGYRGGREYRNYRESSPLEGAQSGLKESHMVRDSAHLQRNGNKREPLRPLDHRNYREFRQSNNYDDSHLVSSRLVQPGPENHMHHSKGNHGNEPSGLRYDHRDSAVLVESRSRYAAALGASSPEHGTQHEDFINLAKNNNNEHHNSNRNKLGIDMSPEFRSPEGRFHGGPNQPLNAQQQQQDHNSNTNNRRKSSIKGSYVEETIHKSPTPSELSENNKRGGMQKSRAGGNGARFTIETYVHNVNKTAKDRSLRSSMIESKHHQQMRDSAINGASPMTDHNGKAMSINMNNANNGNNNNYESFRNNRVPQNTQNLASSRVHHNERLGPGLSGLSSANNNISGGEMNDVRSSKFSSKNTHQSRHQTHASKAASQNFGSKINMGMSSSEHHSRRQTMDYKPSTPANAEIVNFVTSLTKIVSQEVVLEDQKLRLISQPDFNLKTVYKMIDKTQKGSFDFEEFRSFLSGIRVKVTDARSLIDLYSSFDKNQICYLGYEELSSMLLPIDPEKRYQDKLARSFSEEPEGGFCEATLGILTELFNELFKMRKIITEAKREIKKQGIQLNDVFDYFDEENNSFATTERVKSVAVWALGKRGQVLGVVEDDGSQSRWSDLSVKLFAERVSLEGFSDGNINFKDFYIFFSV